MKTRRLFAAAAALVLGLGCGITASASERVVSYGFVFNPQFYAETNPDVAAMYGTNPQTPYRHYVEHGKAKGHVQRPEQ